MSGKYANLRAALGNKRLSDREIESILRRQNLEAGSVEDFLDDLGNLAASALPAVGGAIGSIIAPGVGTAIGSGLGSLAGSALHSAIGPSPAAPAQLPQQQAGLPYGMPAGLPASSQQLVATLLQVLSQPGMLQALSSMLLGQAGTPTVPVANTQVPVSAFTNLLSTLAGHASEAYNSERAASAYPESAPYGWAPGVDGGSPDMRAGRLMQLMAGESTRARRVQKLHAVARYLKQA